MKKIKNKGGRKKKRIWSVLLKVRGIDENIKRYDSRNSTVK